MVMGRKEGIEIRKGDGKGREKGIITIKVNLGRRCGS